MSSGLRIRADKGPQPIKIWWLLDELKKKKISQKAFAERLGITINILNGSCGVFPADKVDECMRLLENWDGAALAVPPGGRKVADHPWNGLALKAGKLG